MRLHQLAITALMTALGAFMAQAGQVDWSSSAFSIHERSDGTALDDSFVFELGAFANGFVPTNANTAEWSTHWEVAQRAPFNPDTQIVAGSFVTESSTAPFDVASKGYLWGLSLTHPGEWVLLTNTSWKWPALGGANPPVSWTVANATAIVGQVNASGSPFFLRTGSVPSSNPIPWVTGTEWQTDHFTAQQITEGTADWLADPDGDGKTNLDEMTFGTDPLAADNVFGVSVTVSPNDTLELTVTRAPNHVLEHQVEVSGDLRQWDRDKSTDIQVIRESARILVVRDRTPMANQLRRFIRLTSKIDS